MSEIQMDAVRALDKMSARLDRAIEAGDLHTALNAKRELGGALELALMTELISAQEYMDRSERMIDAYYDAMEAGRLS